MFRIEAKKKALRALERLNHERKNKIKKVILPLKSDPIPFRK